MAHRAAATAAAVAAALVAAVPAAGQASPSDVIVSDGSRTYAVARLTDGRLAPGPLCLPADTALAPLALNRVVASVPVAAPRAVALGSEEWNRLSPQLLALAERREREQRLVQATARRAPRFLEWLYASDAGGGMTYYFEVSRRIPSASAPIDVDVDTDPPGTIRVVVSGFAQQQAAGLTPVGTKGELRWEQDGLPQGPRRPDLRPLGVLTPPGDPVWVMDAHAPGTSWVNLFAVGARVTRLLASTRIGNC
jgi:hypothetical protein